MTDLPPAGWYADRQNADLLRWWNGQQWTDATWAGPAGWYPDRALPGRNRYWDGQRWTQRTDHAEPGAWAPGWYVDAYDSALLRWWNGTGNTDKTIPNTPGAQHSPPPVMTQAPRRVKTQAERTPWWIWLAVPAFAILSWLLFGSTCPDYLGC